MITRGSLQHINRLAGFQTPLILAILLLAVTALPWELPEHYALYLPLHSAFEIASSAVAFLIFVVGWLSFQRSAPVSIVLIAVTFLGVALIDVGHLLSYEGMPEMLTPSGPEKAIQFWLAARLLAAIGLALAIILPWNQKPASSWLRGALLAGMLAFVTTVFAAIRLAPDSLPDTFDPETGLTAVKIGAEYLVVGIHLLTVGVLWFHHRTLPHIDSRNLATAILIIVLSEIFFTLYVSVTDTFNLLGHVYKIIAYYYLFRAIVVSGIESPYHRLASTQARLKATLEALPDIIFELDREGIVHQFHSRYPHLLARPDAIEGRCLFDFLPDNATTALKNLITDIHEHGRSEAHHYNLEVDGEVRDYEATGNLLQDPSTQSPRYIVIVQDVTQRKHLNHELRIAAAAFESQESICITDADHRILRVNSAFTRITGYEQDEMVGRDPAVLLPENGRRDLRRRLEQCMKRRSRWRGEVQLCRKDGEVHSQLMLVTAVHGEQGTVRNFIYDYIDISALKKAETRIQKLALYDSLTGLGNRHLLEMRLSRAIEESHESGQFGGLLFINLVRFKKINDAMGFSAGDQLLIEIARELRGLADHLITPFRQGADEFALIIENAGDDATAAGGAVGTLSERVFAALNRAFTINGEEYFNRCRIGGTVFGGETLESGDVLNQAGIAVHQVMSDRGRPFSFFDPKMQAAVTREQSLESDLRRAISGRQLILHYQPKVDAHRRVIGLEALIRWDHPERGLLHPGEFIPAAEKTGLIVPIEKWILEQAIAQLARWQQAGTPFSVWSISVNVASSQFYRDEFESQLASLLERYGVQAGRLILEFTESTLLNDVHAAQIRIRRLADQGIRFSIDDFGIGYSSLAYLGRLPVHELKIDRSFVSDFDKEAYNAAIVRMVIEMAHILGMQVVAEGVETEEQYHFLLDEGCDLLQGFLFGRPIPVEEIETLYGSTESDVPRTRLSCTDAGCL